jgi:hypothetical protein
VTIQISGYDVQIDEEDWEILGDKAKLNFPENKGATA